MSVQKVIAIDGPSGSGKSTIAKLLAENLSVLYIDTGAMFRAIACHCQNNDIELIDNEEFKNMINSINIEYGISDSVLIKINGVDLTQQIREHYVSYLASTISQIPIVRTKLLEFQRSLVEDNICVMEGRDIGSIVFPSAFIKFFVTASVEIRAKRRLKQLQEKGSVDLSLEQVQKDVVERDRKDAERSVAPLIKGDDAVLVDTSSLSTVETILVMKEQIQMKAKEFGLIL